jgi:YHS domain-containing protein
MEKALVFLFTLFSVVLFSQNDSKRISHYNLENKIAIQGYDPVAYFTIGKAVKGKKEIFASYQGVIYKFSSNQNKEAFLKNPSEYEPQYGGWCAYAMGSTGDKIEINPETFKIINGKLYLFYNAYFNNTLKSWDKSETAIKIKADNNWKNIIK